MNKISLALCALVAATPMALHAQEVTLRLSHWIPAGIAPAAEGIEPWAKAVEAASDGRIEIKIFPAQQMGKAPDHYDMAAQGIVDMAWVNPGYTAGRFPIYALTEVPFMVSDSVRGAKAIHEWYAEFGAPAEMPDVKLCFIHPHAPGALHSKVKITKPEEISGKTIRPAHATMARFVSLLGGAPVQVPAPEVREALSRGVAEAVTFPWGSMYDFKLTDEVQQHLDMPFYMSAQTLLINPASYDALSDENKAVIDAHCTPEQSSVVAQGWFDDDMAAREKLIADPEQVLNVPTDEEIAAWRAAAEPLIAEWREAVAAKGGDADAIYDGYIKALEANDARY
ncbi:TRAP transporter substrate-binding protein [Pseudosulfitobacter koreensis]|uniref:TRAP transporter substrate-binding protein n=1 Tax=Pseudosulfitobacter koreensis TaxID=2968472 RepID=A0ABT1Z4Z9_9RHOB|nr:TRAP transporter substrate-binding protein [Pseudosulfitobacter koreense]MCR8828217.1 TRAP transporter substrate-binding protein [Pseudosulfitobacter koreense]